MLKKEQKGFTLVEVMISMVILAMLSLPLLTFFANSAKTGVTAAQMQASTALGDSLMEEMKAHSTIPSMLSYNVSNAGIATGLNGAIDPDLVSDSAIYETNGTLGVPAANVYISSVSRSGLEWEIPDTMAKDIYYLEKRNVVYGSHMYDARIEINTLGNSAQPDKFKDGSSTSVKVNDKKLPEIQLVGSGESVSALQSMDDASNSLTSLKLLLQSMDNAEAEAEFAITNPGEVYSGSMPYRSFGTGSDSDLGYVSDVSRTMKVDLSPYEISPGNLDADRTVVTVWTEYSCEYNPVSQHAIDAAPPGTYPKTCTVKNSNIVRATTLTKDLKKLYLFVYSAADTLKTGGALVSGDLKDDKDNVEISVSTGYPVGGTPKPDLYLVYQQPSSDVKVASQLHWKMNVNGSDKLNMVLTNVPEGQITCSDSSTEKKGELILEQTTPKNRIVNVKIDIYDAGYLHKSDYAEHLRNTFESTVSLAE